MGRLGKFLWGTMVGVGLVWAVPASAEVGAPPHRVLILQSYNERFSWVASINRGLEQGLDGPGWDL